MSPEASYVAGDWVAISAPGRWLLIDLPPQDEVVQRCWSVISAGGEVEDVLDTVISVGLRAAPSFALVFVADRGTRAVVRGVAVVRVLADGVSSEVAATGRAVWVDEDIAAGADAITLAGGKPGLSAVELPMGSGVSLAATVAVSITGREAKPAEGVEPRPVSSEPVRDSEPQPPSEDGPPAAEDQPDTPSYDFLFGATQRPLPVEDVVQEPAPQPDPSMTATWHTMAPPEDQPIPVPDVPAAVQESSGLIDAVPGWGAVPEEPPPGIPVAMPDMVDDAPEVVARTTNRAALLAQLADVPPIAGPTVLAGRCPAGHLTPAHSAHCRVCRAEVPEQVGFEIARPALGVLQLSTGDSVTLDRGVFIGRAPSAPEGAEQRPHLVRVASPENDVSRTHAEVVLDGWHVFIRDLGSTNGTTVELPGQPPVRLRSDDLQLLEPGAVITLADEIRCVFEVRP